ncbi:MAG TPA: nuclear transport factor 2 family protein [Candidatus Dormibacteraeota bacterium]|nr:nuclear transport factor 2 family protein [Candidatus Dormibacteraeota bacterium]
MAETGTKLTVDQKIDIVRKDFDAFKRGDLQTISDSFSDDIVWHGRGSTRFGGDFKGKQATMAQILDFAQTFQDINFEIHDIVASQEHVVALVNSSVTRNGKKYSDKEAFIFHINDSGKTTETWVASDTEQLKKALED